MKNLLLYFLFGATICDAQSSISLKESINIALQRNLDIQISRNNLEANSINNHIGVAGGLPNVTGNAAVTEQRSSITQERASGEKTEIDWAKGNNVNASITATQLLFNGFRVHATKQRLEELQQLSEKQLNSLIQNTIANVTVQYYDIVRQQSYTKTINISQEAAQKRLEIIKARQSVGLANNVDLYQTEIDVNNFSQQLRQQQLQEQQAKADFLLLLNLPFDTTIAIADTIIVDGKIELKEIIQSGESNLDLAAAKHQVKILEWIEKETAAQRYPALTLNGGYNYSRTQTPAGFATMNQSYGPQIGVGLTMPFYSGGALKKQQRVASIETKNAKLEKENLEQIVRTEITKSFLAYKNNLNQLITEQTNYELAYKLLDLITRRFELGHATIIEVKDAQSSFVNTGFRVVNLSYAAKVAEVELKRIANKLNF